MAYNAAGSSFRRIEQEIYEASPERVNIDLERTEVEDKMEKVHFYYASMHRAIRRRNRIHQLAYAYIIGGIIAENMNH